MSRIVTRMWCWPQLISRTCLTACTRCIREKMKRSDLAGLNTGNFSKVLFFSDVQRITLFGVSSQLDVLWLSDWRSCMSQLGDEEKRKRKHGLLIWFINMYVFQPSFRRFWWGRFSSFGENFAEITVIVFDGDNVVCLWSECHLVFILIAVQAADNICCGGFVFER